MEPIEEGTVVIVHEGKPHTAHYEVDEDGIVTVYAPFGKKSTQTGILPPKFLATVILREMVKDNQSKKSRIGTFESAFLFFSPFR